MRLHEQVGALLLVVLFTFLGTTAQAGETGNPQSDYRLRMSFDNREVIVKLRDHAINSELLSRLPMTLELQDYIGTEKIAYLPNELVSDGTSPIDTGDFAYYAPWGNIAIFYKGVGRASSGLIVLGTIESGKEYLAAMNANFTARLERID